MTFTQLAHDFAAWMLQPAQSRSRETVTTYARIYLAFHAHLKARGLTDDVRHFTAEHCESFRDALTAAGGKGSSVVVNLSALSALAQYGMRSRREGKLVLTENPTKAFDWPTPMPSERGYLLPDALTAFLAAPTTPEIVIVREFLLDTWLRVGQVIRLTVGDLHEIRGEVYVTVPRKGRGGMRLTTELPVSPGTASLLTDWLLRRNLPSPEEPLFVGHDGRAWTRENLCSAITRTGRRVGVRLNIHMIRHTANSIARSIAGLDEYTRSRLLTHASYTRGAVRSYDHALPHELVQARARYRAALNEYLGIRPSASECAHASIAAVDGQWRCAACGAVFVVAP